MKILEEGEYNLNNLKEISVTDSYMGLDRKNCQNVKAYDDCKTHSHIQNLRQKCGCLPISLRISEKVKFNNWEKISLHECYRILYAWQKKRLSVAKLWNFQDHALG